MSSGEQGRHRKRESVHLQKGQIGEDKRCDVVKDIFHLDPMTSDDSSLGTWEEDELENPLGHVEWAYNSLDDELTVRHH